MRLYHSTTSPFVRKVMVLAHERGLVARLETTPCRPTPLSAHPDLSQVNPLSKVPALVLDDGTALYDSPVICEYLDSLHDGRPVIPARGPERFRILTLQALCDGMVEAGLTIFQERIMRPKELAWDAGLVGQRAKVDQGFDALERVASHFDDELDLAQISAAVAIGWLEFRSVVPRTRQDRPHLDRWYEAFRMRPSMQATEPHA